MHLNRVKKLKIPEGVWKCPPHCLGLQRLNVLRITTKRLLIDSLCFWLPFFFSFDADAIFAKISSANDLLTKYLAEDNVTRGDKDWMNIQNAMYIQYFFPYNTLAAFKNNVFFSQTQEYHTIKTPNTIPVQLLASLLIIFYQGYDHLEGLYAFNFHMSFLPIDCPFFL